METEPTKEDKLQLVGGKRKNGHKCTCSCHICENMQNKAKRGGYTEEALNKQMGGSKKKNGHKMNCKCPICKNMKNSKKRGSGSNSGRRSRKLTGGTPDENEKVEKEEFLAVESKDISGGRKNRGNGHKSICKCPICKNMKNSKKRGGADDDKTDSESDSDNENENNGDILEVEDEGQLPYDPDVDPVTGDKQGGRKNRGNGHKSNCKCPICKNMRKRGGDPERDIENQIPVTGDEEEGGIQATSGSDLQSSSTSNATTGIETNATEDDYVLAEEGKAGVNIFAGGRKRKSRKGRKSRKARTTRRRR